MISLVGTVGWKEEGFGSLNTVNEDVIWDVSDTKQEVNYLIRSQTFTVTFGEPFRLSLRTLTETFAGPGGAGEAWADFYDPSFQGFYVDLGNGEYVTLSSQGYSVSSIPEPATMLLLGLGLLGVLGIRKKGKK